ncbi:MAG: hypothetical protein ACO1O6_06820 [Bacteroidota bacterium]
MKEELIRYIRQMLEEKLIRAKVNFDSIRESLESEGKSTAGDKHETGRAMVQMELEQAGKIIRECEEMVLSFNKLNFSNAHHTAAGSLIYTDKGIFFLGIALGRISFDSNEIFCVGGQAPLFKIFSGRKAGEQVSFGNQVYLIRRVE